MEYAELVTRALAVCDKYFDPMPVEPAIPVELVINKAIELLKAA